MNLQNIRAVEGRKRGPGLLPRLKGMSNQQAPRILVLLIIACSFLVSVFASDSQSPQVFTASTTMDEGEATSLKLFQEALQKNKTGKTEEAVMLFERALKTSTKILSQNDEGLIQALKTQREKEFDLAPAKPETLANLDFVYQVCIGDSNGILPFLRKAAAATVDVTGRQNLEARITQIEQAQAQESALQQKRVKKNLRLVIQTTGAQPTGMSTETNEDPAAEAAAENENEEPETSPPASEPPEKKRLSEAKEREMKDEVEYCQNALPVTETRIRTAEEEVIRLEGECENFPTVIQAAEAAYNSSSSDDNKRVLDAKRKQYEERTQLMNERRKELEDLRRKLRSYNNRLARAQGILDGTINDD